MIRNIMDHSKISFYYKEQKIIFTNVLFILYYNSEL